jgi:hypothetical protein
VSVKPQPESSLLREHFPMMDRRELVAGAFGVAGWMAISVRMAAAKPLTPYQLAIHSTWAPMRLDSSKRELVRFATLADNSHNTQPWKFSIRNDSISIVPDCARVRSLIQTIITCSQVWGVPRRT